MNYYPVLRNVDGDGIVFAERVRSPGSGEDGHWLCEKHADESESTEKDEKIEYLTGCKTS